MRQLTGLLYALTSLAQSVAIILVVGGFGLS